MKKSEAKTSIKKIVSDSASLSPTSLINLFEIDVSEIAVSETLLKNVRFRNSNPQTVFRFHNNVKITQSAIWFQGVKYIAAPISAEGFEISSKGTLPRPRLSLTINPKGVESFSIFKDLMRDLNDLVGAKVIRKRTFLKYIDWENFYKVDSNKNPLNPLVPIVGELDLPKDFDPDPNAEFPNDIYFIDRKSGENKLSLEFELASALELEEVKLPGRILSQKKCPFTYRGEGCCYEYASRKSSIHGDADLPAKAPPIANEKDELISDAVDNYDPVSATIELWKPNTPYPAKKGVFIIVKDINYYYVAKSDGVPANEPPPNSKHWVPDQCSKSLKGCSLRWGDGTEGQKSSTLKGHLPFGGFPGITKR